MKVPISRYERFNTTTLEGFLFTKPGFFKILSLLKGYDYGSFTYFNIVKNKLLNKIEKK